MEKLDKKVYELDQAHREKTVELDNMNSLERLFKEKEIALEIKSLENEMNSIFSYNNYLMVDAGEMRSEAELRSIREQDKETVRKLLKVALFDGIPDLGLYDNYYNIEISRLVNPYYDSQTDLCKFDLYIVFDTPTYNRKNENKMCLCHDDFFLTESDIKEIGLEFGIKEFIEFDYSKLPKNSFRTIRYRSGSTLKEETLTFESNKETKNHR